MPQLAIARQTWLHAARNSGRGSSTSASVAVLVKDNSTNTSQGRVREQQGIDRHGGVDALDNKRNEIAPRKWEEMKEGSGG